MMLSKFQWFVLFFFVFFLISSSSQKMQWHQIVSWHSNILFCYSKENYTTELTLFHTASNFPFFQLAVSPIIGHSSSPYSHAILLSILSLLSFSRFFLYLSLSLIRNFPYYLYLKGTLTRDFRPRFFVLIFSLLGPW